MLLEVCVDSVESAVLAAEGGAGRLELCSSLELGGLTPSVGLLVEVKKRVDIPVFCMLRCRSGDFCYSDEEISVMVTDCEYLLEIGADGFVFGVLRNDETLDPEKCARIINTAQDKPWTLHRAFDILKHSTPVSETLNQLSDLGFTRILTTGGGLDVGSSLPGLSDLYLVSQGTSITILPGGGVNSDNAKTLLEMGYQEIHASCSVLKDERWYGGMFNNPLPPENRKIVSVQKVEELSSLS